MAVDDFLSRDTDTFVLPSKSYYPDVKIKIAHYQLRHFISSPEPDLLYYACGQDVYCLNVATKTQAHVTTLPWEARCTASGHGYICVGGESDGNFAAIKAAGFPPTDPSDVDALLPIDLARRATALRPPILGAAHRVRFDKIGENIVNSISIHKFPAEGDREDEVVAVLTNNDKTVRIYSLTLNREVSVLNLPFSMNHATISPDGQLLVAVGDQHLGFFFQRVKTPKPTTMKTPEGRSQSVPPDWALFEEVRLYVPPGSSIEGYFTTAWSPSGRLCAVGSECGYITVFDVELLRIREYGEDAIVQLISSTRPDPNAGPGAVRTMQFSPAPWDLLIWSEGQARVCVADIRSGLKVKQVLTLDPNEEDLERIEIADFDFNLRPEMHAVRREADFIRRYRRALDSEGNAAAVNFATDYIEASSERRRLHRQLGVVESDDDPHGLTAQERQILEALRTTRQRDEVHDHGTPPRSIHYNTWGAGDRWYRISRAAYFPSLRSDGRNRETEAESRGDTNDSLLSQLNALHEDDGRRHEGAREALGSTPGAATGRHGDREADARWLSQWNALHEGDRRRLSQYEAVRSNREATRNTTETANSRLPDSILAHARRLEAQVVTSTDDAWRTIEEALARSARGTDGTRNAASSEARTERRLRQLSQAREQLRNPREGQPMVGYMSAHYRRASRSTHDPSDGVRTAGLAMSQDGRTLYCGTEEGIFEFRINLHERKGLPAITPR